MDKQITNVEIFNGGSVTVEVSDTTDGYFHRICVSHIAKSEWKGYEKLAVVEFGSVSYFHATEHFDGVLPMVGVIVTLN